MKRRSFLRNGAASGLAAAIIPGAASGAQSNSESQITQIRAPQGPKPAGPHSQAIKANGFIFAAGQTAHDPRTGKLIRGDISAQTERAIENLKLVLEAAGSSLDRAVQATVYLADMNDFEAMGKVYSRYFPSRPPARATVQVAALHGGARVEIELIAVA